MSVDILGTSWDWCRSMVRYCFTSRETRRLVRTATSTLTQLRNYDITPFQILCIYNEKQTPSLFVLMALLRKFYSYVNKETNKLRIALSLLICKSMCFLVDIWDFRIEVLLAQLLSSASVKSKTSFQQTASDIMSITLWFITNFVFLYFFLSFFLSLFSNTELIQSFPAWVLPLAVHLLSLIHISEPTRPP